MPSISVVVPFPFPYIIVAPIRDSPVTASVIVPLKAVWAEAWTLKNIAKKNWGLTNDEII